jgi:hypothetical protein
MLTNPEITTVKKFECLDILKFIRDIFIVFKTTVLRLFEI